MSKVTVKLTKEGNVITQNANKPEFGYFLVQGEAGPITFSENNFMNRQRARQCLVAAPWADLLLATESGMLLGNGTTVVLKEGAELPGKIIIRESTNPYDLVAEFDRFGKPTNVNTDSMVKYRSAAHREAGICYRVDDQPVYQKKFFVTNLDAQDVLVTATNTAEVNAYAAEQIAAGNVNLLADWNPVAKAGARAVAGAKK